MTTTDKLRELWEQDETERALWREVTRSSTWNRVSELVVAEITEEATSGLGGITGDTIYARKLKEIQVARRVIQLLQTRWMLPKEEERQEDEPYSDDHAKAYQERKEKELST